MFWVLSLLVSPGSRFAKKSVVSVAGISSTVPYCYCLGGRLAETCVLPGITSIVPYCPRLGGTLGGTSVLAGISSIVP